MITKHEEKQGNVLITTENFTNGYKPRSDR